MVPITADDRVVLVRQYRYPIGRALWELPAGTIAGRECDGRVMATESPEETASRELLEETGYEAARLEKIAEWHARPGGQDQRGHRFVARRLRRRAQRLQARAIIAAGGALPPPPPEARSPVGGT